MAQLDELTGTSSALHDALAAGIADISQATTVTFTVYQKLVLPLDGFVFWVRTSTFDQSGAVHWLTEREQEESETRARNVVIFTTTERIEDLNQSNNQILVVGDLIGRKFAFGRHNWYFPQAGIWHYQGDGLPASLDTQLVDDPSQLDPTKLIVSNSLPAWLALVSYDPVWVSWPVDRNPHVTLYPSYLVPDNQPPPYGAVHIEPSRTEALQTTAMWLTPTYDHYQLTREAVRVTLYGCNNDMAADFLDLALQYSLDTDAFGLMNMPTIRDGKKTWSDGMVIGQEKVIDFEVSYVQTRINDVARQLITEAIATILPDDLARTTATSAAQAGISASANVAASLGGSLNAVGGISAHI